MGPKLLFLLAMLAFLACETRLFGPDDVRCTKADTLTVATATDTLARGIACWELCALADSTICWVPNHDSTDWVRK